MKVEQTSAGISQDVQKKKKKNFIMILSDAFSFWHFRIGMTLWAQAKVRWVHLCYFAAIRQGRLW